MIYFSMFQNEQRHKELLEGPNRTYENGWGYTLRSRTKTNINFSLNRYEIAFNKVLLIYVLSLV